MKYPRLTKETITSLEALVAHLGAQCVGNEKERGWRYLKDLLEVEASPEQRAKRDRELERVRQYKSRTRA